MKRLQVLLPGTELLDIQRIARRRHMTTAEWVRQALRAAHQAEAGASGGVRASVEQHHGAPPTTRVTTAFRRPGSGG